MNNFMISSKTYNLVCTLPQHHFTSSTSRIESEKFNINWVIFDDLKTWTKFLSFPLFDSPSSALIFDRIQLEGNFYVSNYSSYVLEL